MIRNSVFSASAVWSAALIVMTFAAAGFAEDLALGEHEILDLALTNDVTHTGSLYADVRARRIEVGGTNAWTFSPAALQTRSDLTVAVRTGAVRIVPGTRPEISKPTEVLNKAALWLDANVEDSLEASPDGDGIATWYDVRETKLATGWTSNYYCMAAQLSFVTNASGTKIIRYPVLKTYTDRPDRQYVHFNGMTSGSWMRAQDGKRDNTLAKIDKIKHVFYGGYITNSYGYILGANSTQAIVWHPGASNGKITSTFLSYASAMPLLFAGSSYFNGARVDMGAVSLKTGPFQYEWCAAYNDAYFGNFFNDRNIWSDTNGYRCGGDSVGEVVVFTNRLTELERQQVGEYLLRRWGFAAEPGTVSVDLAPGASGIMSDSASTPVSGAGTIRIADEDAEFPYSQAKPFWGTTRTTASNRLLAAEPSLALASGDAFAVARTSFDDHDVTRSSAADDGAASFALTSDATVRVDEIPSGVTNLTVSGEGALVLSAPRAESTVKPVTGEIYATMPNGDFEAWTTYASATTFGDKASIGTTTCDWKCLSATDGASSYFVNLDYCRTHGGHWTVGGAMFDYANYPFQGKVVMVLKQGITVSTTVNFPADGEYEMTFLSAGRMGGGIDQYAGGWVKMSLVDAQGVTNEIGTAMGYVLNSNLKQRFRVRNVTAGTYTLILNHDVGSQDAHTILDDFKFRLVTDRTDETTLPLPNGDFERASFTGATRLKRSTQNVPADWTLTQETNATPDVCLITRGMCGKEPEATFMPSPLGYGGIELALYGKGGSATSAAFTIPAGTWKLRGSFGGQFYDESSQQWNGRRTSASHKIQAWVIQDETETSLGTSENTSREEMQTTVFPNTVTFSQPTTIRIKIRQVSVSSTRSVPCAYVDDLELVRMEDDDTILQEDFMAQGSWVFKKNIDGTEYTSKSSVKCDDPCRLVKDVAGYPYGVNYGADNRALDICQCGSAHKSLTFPAAGVYRLDYSARSRVWIYTTGASPSLRWGGNAAWMYLVDANGVTNEIHRTPSIWGTNFTFRTALFTVPAAGTYTFGIQGLNGLPQPDGSHLKVGYTADDVELFIDQLSITRVRESESELALPADLNLLAGAGTKLRLEFMGTNEIARLKVNGRGVSGYVDQFHASGLVSGPGCLFVRPRGLILFLK